MHAMLDLLESVSLYALLEAMSRSWLLLTTDFCCCITMHVSPFRAAVMAPWCETVFSSSATTTCMSSASLLSCVTCKSACQDNQTACHRFASSTHVCTHCQIDTQRTQLAGSACTACMICMQFWLLMFQDHATTKYMQHVVCLLCVTETFHDRAVFARSARTKHQFETQPWMEDKVRRATTKRCIQSGCQLTCASSCSADAVFCCSVGCRAVNSRCIASTAVLVSCSLVSPFTRRPLDAVSWLCCSPSIVVKRASMSRKLLGVT